MPGGGANRRILLFGGFDIGEGYPRARSLAAALESRGVEVHVLRDDLLPAGSARRALVARPWRWPAAGWRLLRRGRALCDALRATVAELDPAAILVPYPGWFSVGDARRVFGGPVLLDLFLSLSDTVIGDRRMFRSGGLVDGLLRRLDRRACSRADRVLVDTPGQADFAASVTGLERDRFHWVPIGDPSAPAEAPPPASWSPGTPLRVLYVGTGVPLHGVETILQACARTDGVRLTFVGGTELDRQRALALGPDKVELVRPWVDGVQMRGLFATRHVAFGIFGRSDKTTRVIPFKVVHALAHSRITVTAETPAVQCLLDPGYDCLTVPAADPVALARALRCVLAGPRLLSRIGRRARERYDRTFSPAAIGERLLLALEDVSGESWRRDRTPGSESSSPGEPAETVAS